MTRREFDFALAIAAVNILGVIMAGEVFGKDSLIARGIAVGLTIVCALIVANLPHIVRRINGRR
jgi:hypothetical protein